MVLDSLSGALRSSIKKLVNRVLIDTKAVDEFIKDIQKALISADVDVSLVFTLTKRIKERILEDKNFGKKEQIVRIVYEEIVSLLGKGGESLSVPKKPFKILLVGLFGSGKTTTSGKISLRFKKKGYKPCLLALDTFRAAAREQLRQVGLNAGVTVFSDDKEKKPEKVVKKFSSDWSKFDVVIGDSAGRDALDKSLISEVKAINKEFKPDETWLVVPADIGQSAKKQAEAFRDALNITGVIITKLDSTAKGGGALTACAVSGAPVKFIGVGESIDDFELFNPSRFVSRLLGMGDLESLLEKAKEELDEDRIKDLGEKMLKGEFNFLDLNEQLRAVTKMGSFSKLLSFIPGVGGLKLPDGALDIQEENVKKFQVIMNSMTLEELENPKLLSVSRIQRIAKGAGVSEGDVRLLLKQYNQMKGVMKKMKGGNLKKMMKQLGIKDMSQLEGMMGG
ncbi:MAG TPA: signal recognition particle receptor subunit alpha, partial [Candidatus Nanoarchaeia archaeon]|nr:signal recognition particle receptor subunit alpha [Candidatus Nanoarchaeia archaeon]